MDIKDIGKFCKTFRVEILKLSLTDFSNNCNGNIKNISSFESGRANNIKYLYYYYNQCKNNFIRNLFTKGVFNNGND